VLRAWPRPEIGEESGEGSPSLGERIAALSHPPHVLPRAIFRRARLAMRDVMQVLLAQASARPRVPFAQMLAHNAALFSAVAPAFP
jgi:hypothetical protein